jgi:hypothetical protein
VVILRSPSNKASELVGLTLRIICASTVNIFSVTLNGQSFILAANFVACTDNSNQIAYTTPSLSLIVLCPSAFERPATIGSPVTAVPDGRPIDSLRTLSNFLLHEFIHAFGGPNSMSTNLVSPLNTSLTADID